jgi:hypothetical protein
MLAPLNSSCISRLFLSGLALARLKNPKDIFQRIKSSGGARAKPAGLRQSIKSFIRIQNDEYFFIISQNNTLAA